MENLYSEIMHVDVSIIGGGLAGTSVAYALAKEGLRIKLIERSALASGASGNALGLVTPYITRDPLIARLHYEAVSSVLLQCEELEIVPLWNQVLQLPSTDRLAESYDNLSEHLQGYIKRVTAEEASELCRISINQNSFLYTHAAVIPPATVCERRLGTFKNLIQVHTALEAIDLQHKDGFWRALGKQGNEISKSKIVVVANAYDAAQFSQTKFLPLEAVRGQLLFAEPSDLSRQLQIPICYDGYIFPVYQGSHLIGASYAHRDFSPEISEKKNNDMLTRLTKRTGFSLKASSQPGRVSFRASTFDRLPYVGAINESLCRAQGLYVSAGFGSKGISLSLISSLLLKEIICNDSDKLQEDFGNLLSPHRAYRRALKQKAAI